MSRLESELAEIVKARVGEAVRALPVGEPEVRAIFHGPPLEVLEPVFRRVAEGGALVLPGASGREVRVPVLLQVARESTSFENPSIGESGRCDETHLLNLRNVPSCPRYIALVPPGQHQTLSVSTTTYEFGIASSRNSGTTAFDEWWADPFIHDLVGRGLERSGFRPDDDQARMLLEYAARCADEVDDERYCRRAAWRLLSRLFEASDSALGLPRPALVALACGVPPTDDGTLHPRDQVDVLQHLAAALGDGFRNGIDQAKQNAASPAEQQYLDDFLAFIRDVGGAPTAFERATAAFYSTSRGLDLEQPPAWWLHLTVERWLELLNEDQDPLGDLQVECTNWVVPPVKGMPAVVEDAVELKVSSAGAARIRATVERRAGGGSKGLDVQAIDIQGQAMHADPSPPPHKTPIRYRVSAPEHADATTKVISLRSWQPGVVVWCRNARKVTIPKAAGKGNKDRVDLLCALSVPGPGRYYVEVFLSPGARIGDEAHGRSSSGDALEEASAIRLVQVSETRFAVEVEVAGDYELDLHVQRQAGPAQSKETCRIHIECEDAPEEGCRSEFERLIRHNRLYIERLGTKAVVQVDRNFRASDLQGWMLDANQVGRSFGPVVIAEDYAERWRQPDWGKDEGPLFTKGRFLQDPRPIAAELAGAPASFITARAAIASRLRGADNAGVVEAAPVGEWISRDPLFREEVEAYVDGYLAWLAADPDTACWVDVAMVTSLEAEGRAIASEPDAIILSPLHPLRLAWHCMAQQTLHQALEASAPCPAASVLDADCIPDLLTLALRSPSGIEYRTYIAVECNSDYWSVLWNGNRLGQLVDRCRYAPFDGSFGVTVGGVSSGFSAAQVGRALDDVSELLAAKPALGVLLASAGGATDACNEGMLTWCRDRFGAKDPRQGPGGLGPRILKVFDTRADEAARPDDATIANLSEDTGNAVRWFEGKPASAKPDLGVIAQLDSSGPALASTEGRSPVSHGALIRHRVRRQLSGASNAFIGETRQGLAPPPSGSPLMDKVARGVVSLENRNEGRLSFRFAPNVHAVQAMLVEERADFVAVSSSAIDPACFLGEWLQGAYLWDYDMPSYSQRAGDTNGYYLLSQVKEVDRDGLRKVLSRMPGCDALADAEVNEILLEVARRGIPTVRGLSGDDTGATGDLGLFVAVRLLQDQFRAGGNQGSLVPLISGTKGEARLSIVVPVDPFRGYIEDLIRSLRREKRDMSLLRPDLLVIGVLANGEGISIRLTPVEVKCRLGSQMPSAQCADALSQARALSDLFQALRSKGDDAGLLLWRTAFQHLLLSIVSFGFRVYSQHGDAADPSARWSEYHERTAAGILAGSARIEIDARGRLIVVDSSPRSEARDCDGDGFAETMVICPVDAGRIVAGDPSGLYEGVRQKIGQWQLLPAAPEPERGASPAGGSSELAAVPAIPEAAGNSTETGGDPARDARFPPPDLLDVGQHAGSRKEPTPGYGGVALSVGSTVGGFEPKAVSLAISDTRLNQLNIGVVGDLGTGKTQLLKSLIFQIAVARDANRGIAPRFLIFDYKKDYSGDDFVSATGARVVRPHRLPLNLFDTTGLGDSAAPWLDRFRFFADVLDKIYSGIGPVQRDKLKQAVKRSYEACEAAGGQPTIYDVHAEYRQLLGGKSDSPLAIIDDLVDMELFSREPAETIPFERFLDGVVVVSLGALGQDDRTKNMLVAVMLNMFYEYMLRIPKRPFVGTDPQLRVVDSYLLIDEADNIMRYEFDVLRKVLLQGREFGAGVILASQYLRHFKAGASDYREPLLTWFIHKVPNVTGPELAALGFTSDVAELAERVKTLPNHHCLFKSFNMPGEVIRGKPFFELPLGK